MFHGFGVGLCLSGVVKGERKIKGKEDKEEERRICKCNTDYRSN